MSFTALRSSSFTLKSITTSATNNSIVSSFENTGWKSLVSILQEASIISLVFSNDEQKTNKQSQHVPSIISSSSGITYAPWMRYNEYSRQHDVLSSSSSKYSCPISIHGMIMPIQSSLSASSAFGSRGDSYNLSLFQLPIDLESENAVAHDAEDDDDDDDESKNTNNSGIILHDLSTWLISTLKRRKKKMNKHKLRKRRKLERLKSKK